MPGHFRALHSGGGKDPLRHQCGKIAMGRPLQRQSEQGKPGVGIIKPFRRLQGGLVHHRDQRGSIVAPGILPPGNIAQNSQPLPNRRGERWQS